MKPNSFPGRFFGVTCVVISTFASSCQGSDGQDTQTSVNTSTTLPHFDRMVMLEEEPATSANVSIGDLNGDGNLDIVLAKGRHWPLVDRVLFGDGKGAFPVSEDLSTVSDRSYSGLLVDLDADGDLDIVISNDRPDPKLAYLNDGSGQFRVGSTFGRAEWSTRNASIADLNGDGLPDIIVANRTGDDPGANFVCLNQGGGEFGSDCIEFSNESATTITPADFNDDGLIDLVVPHREGGQSYIYMLESSVNLTFRRVPFGSPNAAIRVSAVADFDVDGHLDIVGIDQRHGVTLYFGEGGDHFSAGVVVGDTTLTPYALAVGDLNLDERPDIVVGHVEAPSTVYVNDGSGRTFRPVPLGDDRGTAYGFDIGDLDGDGQPDIAVARSDAQNVLYFGSSSDVTGRN